MKRLWMKTVVAGMFALAAIPAVPAQGSPPPRMPRSPASPTQVRRAEDLYTRAMKLMNDKKWGRAARLLEASDAIDPAMETQYRLAECYERMGRLALAWSAFTGIAHAAKEAGRADREHVAQLRADIIEPWIVFVVIAVPQEEAVTPGLRIMLDDHVLERSQWSAGIKRGIPVDPGEHLLWASAPGKLSVRRRFRARHADSNVLVRLPALAEPAVASRTAGP